MRQNVARLAFAVLQPETTYRRRSDSPLVMLERLTEGSPSDTPELSNGGCLPGRAGGSPGYASSPWRKCVFSRRGQVRREAAGVDVCARLGVRCAAGDPQEVADDVDQD